jgi:CRP-like cAMP-binding protein
MTYSFVPKGKYVFRQGDECDGFYGIIKGLVSIRVARKISTVSYFRRSILNLNDEDKLDIRPEPVVQREILKISDGETFGDWGLMRKTTRRASAYAIEDSHLFHISEGSFYLSLCKIMLRAELERKNFICNRILPFEELSRTAFDSLYKSFQPKFVSKNEIVFDEREQAHSLYIILAGSFTLLKAIGSSKTELAPTRYIPIIKVEKGGVAGIESLFDQFYKHSLRSDTDYSCMMVIKTISLENKLRDRLKDYFKNLYELNEKNYKETMRKRKDFELKVSYRKPIVEKFEFNEKILNEKAINFINDTVNQRKSPSNTFKNFKIQVLKKDKLISEIKRPNSSLRTIESSNNIYNMNPSKVVSAMEFNFLGKENRGK